MGTRQSIDRPGTIAAPALCPNRAREAPSAIGTQSPPGRGITQRIESPTKIADTPRSGCRRSTRVRSEIGSRSSAPVSGSRNDVQPGSMRGQWWTTKRSPSGVQPPGRIKLARVPNEGAGSELLARVDDEERPVSPPRSRDTYISWRPSSGASTPPYRYPGCRGHVPGRWSFDEEGGPRPEPGPRRTSVGHNHNPATVR